LVDHLRAAKYYQSMNGQVIIEEHPKPPELGRLFKQARRNPLWLKENVERLEVCKRHCGKY
jgi:hypothetical protein